jgi:hypothetical protein
VKPKKEVGLAAQAFSEPDRFVDDAIEKFRVNAQQLRSDAVSYVKREPQKALLSALAAGYVLRTLPVLPIVGLLARVTVGAFKPLALLYLAAKVVGSSQGRANKGLDA